MLVGLLVLLFLGGFTISRVENLELGDGIYFAFITGLSIGYGDITPATAWGRVVSVLIGLIGMIFVGLTVAVATRALADSIKEHLLPETDPGDQRHGRLPCCLPRHSGVLCASSRHFAEATGPYSVHPP